MLTHSIHILFVDDEQAFVDSITKTLRKKGFTITPAYNGKTALALIEKATFDVIVLDVRMPELDGFTVLKKIRAKNSLIPVILLTGHFDIERTKVALKEGAFDILPKPCSIDNLINVIENAFEWKGLQDSGIKKP